jgi:Tfp pilus assembly protein PilX
MRRRQRGIALVGVLGVVLIVSLITLTALERARLQIRTVTATIDQAQALEAAEFALREAARQAAQWSRPALQPTPVPRRRAWRAVLMAEGRTLSLPHRTDDGAPPLRVLVERLRPVSRPDCSGGGCGYRISALAGGRGATRASVLLQARLVDGSPLRTWRALQ